MTFDEARSIYALRQGGMRAWALHVDTFRAIAAEQGIGLSDERQPFLTLPVTLLTVPVVFVGDHQPEGVIV